MRSKVAGGDATLALVRDEGRDPHVEIAARLDLAAPTSGRGLCQIPVTPPPAPPEPVAGPPCVILRGKKARAVTVSRGAETLFEEARTSAAGDGVARPCSALCADARVVVADPGEREPPRVWQLPGLVPSLEVGLPGGARVAAAFEVAALDIDLDRGSLAVFFRGATRPSPQLIGLDDAALRVEGGFVPSAAVAEIARGVDPPARPPTGAVPLDNASPFEVTSFPFPAGPASEREIVVVKGTFDVAPGAAARVAAGQEPLAGERLHEGGKSLSYPGDFVPEKPRAEVLVAGHAYPKPGAAVARVEVSIGPVSASVVAMGPRRWLPGGHPSEPAPFDRVPLRYDLAFGGPDVPENPAGVGLAAGSPPPSIERPDALLRARGDRAAPAGLGPLARDWAPRRGLLGTFSRVWGSTRWPALPEDFQPAFWNTAPAELTAPSLRGDEAFRVTSVRPGGEDLVGSLPGLAPRCVAEWGRGAPSEVPLRLDTVVIDADTARVILVWRGAVDGRGERGALRRIGVVAAPLGDAAGAIEIRRRVEVARPPGPRASLGPAGAAGAIAMGLPAPRGATRAQVEGWIAAGEGLAGRDLSGADLSGLDLSGVDLSGAILRGTNLDDAKLDRAKADGLRGAGLVARRSSWVGASLARADLAGAALDGADLSGATLAQATFADAELSGCVARRAVAGSALFVRARMARAALEEARLEKADLSGAVLDGARLTGAVLDDAKLYEALGEGLVADGASLVDARLEAARLPRASFRGARCAGSMWEQASLPEVDFSSADLAGAGFAGADLSGARLTGAELSGARLAGATLARASLAGANLMRASLEGALAPGADLSGANLYQAETWRAQLAGATVTGAFLKGTKLG